MRHKKKSSEGWKENAVGEGRSVASPDTYLTDRQTEDERNKSREAPISIVEEDKESQILHSDLTVRLDQDKTRDGSKVRTRARGSG